MEMSADQTLARGAPHGTIVVIEDDRNISDLIDLYLRNAGYRVLQAAEGERGLELIANETPVLVLLDLGLPGALDGIEVCRQLRRRGDVPIVIVSARDDEVDRILGLELGADDYLTKPFSPRELVARVRAVLRRYDHTESAEEGPRSVGDVVVDPQRREVTAGGEPVTLTAREFDLLWHFVCHTGIVYNRRQLLDGVWGDGWIGDERTVDVHVRQLRRKLGEHFPITTIWGVGYRCG
jgi:DNA-binding response OmpR family regulator